LLDWLVAASLDLESIAAGPTTFGAEQLLFFVSGTGAAFDELECDSAPISIADWLAAPVPVFRFDSLPVFATGVSAALAAARGGPLARDVSIGAAEAFELELKLLLTAAGAFTSRDGVKTDSAAGTGECRAVRGASGKVRLLAT